MFIKKLYDISRKRLDAAKDGKKVYRRIYSEFIPEWEFDATVLVVFPDDEPIFNYYGLLYLDEYLVRFLKMNALIVTSNRIVAETARLFTYKIKDVLLLSPKDIEGLIRLYCLHPFENTLFISASKPDGRTAFKIVGAKGITKEMIVAIGMYNIIPFRTVPKVLVGKYLGEDEEILRFLECEE